jgi:N-acetyl-anhydromuramyl-L-alanine amidase AmpD
MIHLDGKVEILTPFDEDDDVEKWEVTNGAAGINSISRHIVYVGGTDKNGRAKDTRTQAQRIAMDNFVKQTIAAHPSIKVAGHNQFATKACPCFDVPNYLRSIGVDETNVHK